MDTPYNVEKLKSFSTCDVSDALLKLNHHGGGFIPGISMWSPKRQEGMTKVIGPAYTVKFVMKDETDAPTLQEHHIDTVPAGSVICLSMPQGVENAAYGGLMTHRARYLGALATVVDGNFRDLEEQRKLEFPVFARGVSTHAYYEVARASEVNVPIILQDGVTLIEPGDIVMADLNGVVHIPRKLTGEVVEMTTKLSEADANMATDLQNGVKFSEASKKHRG